MVGRVLSALNHNRQVIPYSKSSRIFWFVKVKMRNYFGFVSANCTKIEIIFVESTKNALFSKIISILIDRSARLLYNLHIDPGLAPHFFVKLKEETQ